MSAANDLPDAIVEIHLRRTDSGWEASQPTDRAGVVGHASTAPRAAEDYCRRAAEFCERRLFDG